jgi:hypothetical protein
LPFLLNHLRLSSPSILMTTLSLSLSLVLRQTVSRPVCLGIKHPYGAYDQIFITVKTVAGLLMWGALSAERTAAGLRTVLLVTSRYNPHRKHRFVTIPLLLQRCLLRRFIETVVLLLRACKFPREPVYRRCLAMNCFGFQASCHNIFLY